MNLPFHTQPPVPRKVADLHIHPAVANDPRMGKDDPRYLEMRAAWTETGRVPDILCTADGGIVDGRHRWWFCQDMGIDEIGCITVAEEDVHTIVLTALSGRNHITKGQRAYFVVGRIRAAHEEAQARRMRLLAQGLAANVRLPAVDANIEEFARKHYGVNSAYYRIAIRLHEAFQEDDKYDFSADGGGKRKMTLKAYFLPRILDAEDPMPIGDAVKGVASKLSPNSKDSGARSLEARRNSGFALALHSFKELGKALGRVPKLKPDEKDEAVRVLNLSWTKAPADLLEDVYKGLKAEIRKRSQQEDAK